MISFLFSLLIFTTTIIFTVHSVLVLQNLQTTYNCLDVFLASQADGAQIGLYPCTPTATNEQWLPSDVRAASISAQHSSKCLVPTTNGLAVTQQACIERVANLTGNQFWVLDSELIARVTYYNFQSFKTLTCLTGNPNRSVTLGSCTKSDAIRWTMSESFGLVRNKLTGLCLDVNLASTADDAIVDQFDCVPLAQNLRWKYISHFVRREIVQHSSKCLTVSGASTAVGAIIDQYTCQTPFALNQLWVEIEEGRTNNHQWYFRLKNVGSGKCLTPGTQLTQQECGSGNWNQLFTKETTQVAAQQYRIKPKQSSKCLMLAEASIADGVLVTQKTCLSPFPGDQELWVYLNSTTQIGYIQLQNMFGQKCLTATTDRQIDQRPCTQATNQLWKVTTFGGFENYQLSGQCLDVLGVNNQADGAQLGTYPCNPNAPNHIFIKD